MLSTVLSAFHISLFKLYNKYEVAVISLALPIRKWAMVFVYNVYINICITSVKYCALFLPSQKETLEKETLDGMMGVLC